MIQIKNHTRLKKTHRNAKKTHTTKKKKLTGRCLQKKKK